MIRKVINTLAQAMGLLDKAKIEQAEELLDEAFEEVTQMSIEMLEQQSPDSLAYLLGLKGNPETLLMAAQILFHKSKAFVQKGDPITGQLMLRFSSKLLKKIQNPFKSSEVQNVFQKLVKDVELSLTGNAADKTVD